MTDDLKTVEAAFAEAFKRLREQGRLVTPQTAGDCPVLIFCGRSQHGGVGSRQVQCEDCKTLLWLSPASLAIMDENPGKPTHIACVLCLQTIARRATRNVPGICRWCYCHEAHACVLDMDGRTCAWANAERTVCTNPDCLRKEAGDAALVC
jgi:hypothetical protein